MSQDTPGYRLSRHVPPTSSACSMMTNDSRPRRASWMPMPMPAKPAPTIRTSTGVMPRASLTRQDLVVPGGALPERPAELPRDPGHFVEAQDEPGLGARVRREAPVEQ